MADSQTTTKCCPKCGEPKALEEFYRDRRAKDGRRSDCKACHGAYYAVARAIESGRLVPLPCESCGLTPLKINGRQRIEAHHHLGYAEANWLKVVWLCYSCHKLTHAGAEESDVSHETSGDRRLACWRKNAGKGNGATLLGGYLGGYMRPSGVMLDELAPEERCKRTMAAVARSIGLTSQSALSRKLNGKRPVTETEAIRLAIEVGASPTEAILLRLADRLDCEPGSVAAMVREVAARDKRTGS